MGQLPSQMPPREEEYRDNFDAFVSEPQMSAADTAKFGPYALHMTRDEYAGDPPLPVAPHPVAQPHISEANVTVMAPANGNTELQDLNEDDDTAQEHASEITAFQSDDAMMAGPAGNAIAATDTPTAETMVASPLSVNASLTDEGRVDVVLTRDTATVSVPVTEATLPNGVANLMRKALEAVKGQATPLVDAPTSHEAKQNIDDASLEGPDMAPALTYDQAEVQCCHWRAPSP